MKEIPKTQRTFAAKQRGRWGLLTQCGEWIVDPAFADIGIPTLDRFPGRRPEDSTWAVYSLSGELIRSLPPGISEVGFPGERLRSFKTHNRWGFMDEEGRQIIEPRFTIFHGSRRGSHLVEFSSGQAAIMIEGGSQDGVYDSLWLALIARDGSWVVSSRRPASKRSATVRS